MSVSHLLVPQYHVVPAQTSRLPAVEFIWIIYSSHESRKHFRTTTLENSQIFQARKKRKLLDPALTRSLTPDYRVLQIVIFAHTAFRFFSVIHRCEVVNTSVRWKYLSVHYLKKKSHEEKTIVIHLLPSSQNKFIFHPLHTYKKKEYPYFIKFQHNYSSLSQISIQ